MIETSANLEDKQLIRKVLLKEIVLYLKIFVASFILLGFNIYSNAKITLSLEKANINKELFLFCIMLIFFCLFIVVFLIQHINIVRDNLALKKEITMATITKKGISNSNFGYLNVSSNETKKVLTVKVDAYTFKETQIGEQIELEYFIHSRKVLRYTYK